MEHQSLPIRHIRHAVEEAKKVIEEGMTGEQQALFSRHPKIRKALLGGWRFNNVYILCGSSGAGKSYYLNMLYQDFCNPELNKEFKKPFKILHFAFEMSAYDEVLRATTSKSKIPYRNLLSADNPLSQEDYAKAIPYLDSLKETEIYFVETTGNVNQIEETVKYFQGKFPEHHIVVGMDHTLLPSYYTEKSEIELVANLAKVAIKIRKDYNCMVIFLNQLNSDIEERERIVNPAIHYPIKRDLFSSKQVYQAADYVIVLHAPEQLGITSYGPDRYPTNGLIAWHLIKARKGHPGIIRLKNELGEGNITEWKDE
jgi:replicative DNA helicase